MNRDEANTFYEEDEPVGEILARFRAGEKGRTVSPPPVRVHCSCSGEPETTIDRVDLDGWLKKHDFCVVYINGVRRKDDMNRT